MGLPLNISRDLIAIMSLFILIAGKCEGYSYDSVCGLKPFDSKQEICCEDSIYPSHRYLCCNGKLENRKNWTSDGQVERICCDSQLVDKDKNVCCDEHLHVLKDSQFPNDFTCCGKNLLEAFGSKSCCGGRPFKTDKIIGCCDGYIYDKEKKKCKYDQILNNYENICNGQKYDMTKDSCCGGVTLNKNLPEWLNREGERNPVFRCCDDEVMDAETENCCSRYRHGHSSHTMPKDPHIRCCGNGHYNVQTQACINHTTVTLGEHGQKCGKFLIDKQYQGCCKNKLPFNITNEQCCSGSKFCILPKDAKCCNGYPLHEDQICCDDKKPVNKTSKDHDACCFYLGNGTTYRKQDNLVCQKGRVTEVIRKEKLSGDSSSPAKVELNNMKRKCDSYKSTRKGKTCCHLTPYRSSSKRKECCAGRDIFDNRFSYCTPEGRVRPKPHKYHRRHCRPYTFERANEHACLRRNAYVGNLKSIRLKRDDSSTYAEMQFRISKTIERPNGRPVGRMAESTSLTISIPMKKPCLNTYRKKPKKYMIFFDEPIKAGRVKISEKSQFFITKYKRSRFRYITKGISEEFCKYYMYS